MAKEHKSTIPTGLPQNQPAEKIVVPGILSKNLNLNFYLFIGMLVLALIGQVFFLFRKINTALFFYEISIILVFVQSYLQSKLRPEGVYSVIPAPGPTTRLSGSFRWSLLLAVILSLNSLTYFSKSFDKAGFVMYLCSILLCAGTIFWADRKSGPQPESHPIFWKSPYVWLLLLICLMGWVMRGCNLNNIPVGGYEDELVWVWQGLEVFLGHVATPFNLEGAGVSSLMVHFFMALFLKVFPSADNLIACKMVSVFFGTLAVLAIYFMLANLFSRRVGLIGSFLLAFSYWHACASRLVYDHIESPFFGIIAVYFLFKAFKTGRLIHFFLGGAALGFGMYFYVTGRILPFVFVLFLIYLFIFQRGMLRAHGKGLLVFFIAVFLIVSPFLKSINPWGPSYSSRISQTSLYNEIGGKHYAAALAKNFVNYLLMCNGIGNHKVRYIPEAFWPQLDFFSSIFFALGLMFALFRFRDPRYLFLLIWYFLMIVPGVVSIAGDAPASWRVSGSIPPIIAFAAIFFDRVVGFVEEQKLKIRKIGRVVLGVVLLYIAVFGLWAIFKVYATSKANFYEALPIETIMSRAIISKMPQYDVYATTGGGLVQMAFNILTTRHGEFKSFDPYRDIPASLCPNKKGAYYFVGGPQTSLAEPLLRVYYPHAKWTNCKDVNKIYDGEYLYRSVEISSQEVSSYYGVDAAYYKGGDISGKPTLQQVEPQIRFAWPGIKPPLPFPFSAVWQGELNIPEFGKYKLGIKAKGKMNMFLDEKPILSHLPSKVPGGKWTDVELIKGRHAFKIVYTSPSSGGDVVELFYGQYKSTGVTVQVVPASSIIRPSSFRIHNGLITNYYKTLDWKGAPVATQLVPVLISSWGDSDPFPGPFSVEFNGKIRIDQEGFYMFHLGSYGDAYLYIDGKIVDVNRSSFTDCKVYLTKKDHALRMRYTFRGGAKSIQLWWTPPSGVRELVPFEVLTP